MAAREVLRRFQTAGSYDLVVCGGGPAGVSAAISAGRAGLKTLLIESQGCLGGIWTSGLMCLVLDARGKAGFLSELKGRLGEVGACLPRNNGPDFLYDPEAMKLQLEDLCAKAGVTVRLHTRVVGAVCADHRIQEVLTESASGGEAFTAPLFVDATGNGDLAAYAGCAYDVGHPVSGRTQPATLYALVSGVPADEPCTRSAEDKKRFLHMLRSVGIDPSYQAPSLFPLPHPGLHCLMINHEYGVRHDSAADITCATIHARKEINDTVLALRQLPGWEELRLVATAAHIGLREGRRIRGMARVTTSDMTTGQRCEDGICLTRFGVDIHALDPEQSATGNEGIKVKPYHIPYRALVARDVSNLALAGRCISGDFFAHASYRVTGDAVPMGEAVGYAAYLALQHQQDFSRVDGDAVAAEMKARGYEL